MAIFARECLKKMQVLAKELEVKLGPDTGDLSMRFGLHRYDVCSFRRFQFLIFCRYF